MANNLFFVTKITLTPLSDGFCVTCFSDVPCHLWMRWTYNAPWKHPKPRLIRGINIEGDVYYCVAGYNDTEQLQAGDTLVHTFQWKHKTTWAGAWIYFSGTIANQPSPSTSPIAHLIPRQELTFKNLSFDTWPDPALGPHYWDKFTNFTGWSKWEPSNSTPTGYGISARLEAGGYARGTGLRQLQSAIPYRNQPIRVSAWGKGYAHVYSNLEIRADGTGGWYLSDPIIDGSNWQKYQVGGLVPFDATTLEIRVRCWSPGFGPTFTWWDEVEITTVL